MAFAAVAVATVDDGIVHLIIIIIRVAQLTLLLDLVH